MSGNAEGWWKPGLGVSASGAEEWVSPVIRSLKPGERIPGFTPKRYYNDNGYVRLRWRVGTDTYVECYEHRVVDGRITTAEHVHHVNGIRDDNRPENLVEMDAEDHNRIHAERVYQRWYPYRSRDAMLRAAWAENRRLDRDRRTEKMRKMYASGMSTIQIAKEVGLHHTGVWRYINLGKNP